MAVFGERFLLGFTSPRNPYLISKYIKVIEENDLDNMPYNSKFQEKFYDVLSKNQVAGEEAGNAKDKALAGRDKLTRMPQALGFFITQSKKNFRVTEAGKLLSNDGLFEDVLLHQMLKYQLPSRLHKEKESNRGYFRIKPFLELLRLINQLEYLTYNELLIFGMTLTDYRKFDNTVENIKEYRIRRAGVKKRKESLRIFDYNVQVEEFKELYKDILETGNLGTRESVTETPEEYMKKKVKNWKDYTDSYFRLLHASGLVVYTQGRSLSINLDRQDEVDYILENVSREIMSTDVSRKQFDEYISNPFQPVLKNDNRENLIRKLSDFGIAANEGDSTYDLKIELSRHRLELKSQIVTQQKENLKRRNENDIKDILSAFSAIKNQEIQPSSMRPTMFEWNVWRAMAMINHGDVQGNFIVDDSGMPVSTASGGQSDIVGDYGDFKIGIEVTLSSGKKQYEMEGEPVSRHIGEMQKEKPSFGIFIAETLNESVIHHFFTLSHQNSKIYNGIVDIIPMNTETFIDFFVRATQKDIQPSDLFSIHQFSTEYSRQALLDGKTEDDWHQVVLDKAFEVVS